MRDSSTNAGRYEKKHREDIIEFCLFITYNVRDNLKNSLSVCNDLKFNGHQRMFLRSCTPEVFIT